MGNLITSILVAFLLICLNTACSTAPEFDRNNENDPSSDNFNADVGSFEVSLNNNKTVSLTWKDNSRFEDGFLIGKTFSKNSEIQILDTLPPNSNSYLDSSGLLSTETSYHLRTFNQNTSKNDSVDFVTQPLTFGKIHSINHNVTSSNKVTLKWESDIAFIDKLSLKKSIPFHNDTPIDTINGDKLSHSFNINEEAYFAHVSITPLLLNHEGKYQELPSVESQRIHINLPSDLDVEIIDEETAFINWTDNTDFNEEFVIYQRPSNNHSEGIGKYTPIDTLSTPGNVTIAYQQQNYYDFNITPLLKNMEGRKIDPAFRTIRTQSPQFTDLESRSSSEVVIHWRDNNANNTDDDRFPTKRFIIEKAVNGSEFAFYKEIAPTARSLVIDDLLNSNKYSFRIRSLSSPYSQRSIGYSLSFETQNKIDIGAAWGRKDRYKVTPLHSNLAISSELLNGNYGLRIIDPTGSSPEHQLNFGTEFDNFSISSKETYIATFGGYNAGVFDKEKSTLTPVFNFENLNSLDFFDLRGMFINDNEMILIDDNKLKRLNVEEQSVVTIDDFSSLETSYFYISSLGKVNSGSIFISTSEGAMIYDLEANTFDIINENNTIQAFAINDNGEILSIEGQSIKIYDKEGTILQTFYKPQEILIANENLVRVIFLGTKYILAGTNQGTILLFDRTTGKNIAYYYLKRRGSRHYLNIERIGTVKKSNSFFVTNRNILTLFDLSEGWSYALLEN